MTVWEAGIRRWTNDPNAVKNLFLDSSVVILDAVDLQYV